MNRARAWCASLLVTIVFLAAPASAQFFPAGPAEGHVRIEIDGPVVTLSRHDDFLRVVTVRVSGLIQCNDGGERPDGVVVVTGVSTDRSKSFWVEDDERTVDWTPSATMGGWEISDEITFGFGTNRDGGNGTTTLSAVALARDAESDTGCTQSGYRITGDRDQYALMVLHERGAAETDAGSSPVSGLGPALVWLGLGALVGALLTWLFLVRIRRPPSPRAKP